MTILLTLLIGLAVLALVVWAVRLLPLDATLLRIVQALLILAFAFWVIEQLRGML